MYISGHPLDEYADQLARLKVNARTLAELSDAPDHGMSMDQKPVRMGGLIAERRMKATRSGGMMAFVQLEDMFGTTEVLVFPKVYDRVGAQLIEDTAVAMSGRLSVREDEAPKLLLDRVVPLRELDNLPNGNARPEAAPPPRYDRPRSEPRPARKLFLRLTARTRDAALRILAETPGNICVVRYMADERKSYVAPRQYWVDEGYDFGALANLIGADGIVLK